MEEKKISVKINGEDKILSREEFIKIFAEKASEKFDAMFAQQEKEKIEEKKEKKEKVFSPENDKKIMKKIAELSDVAYQMDYLTNGGISYEAIELLKELSTEKLLELSKDNYAYEYEKEIKRVLIEERGIKPEDITIEEER